MRFIVHDYSGHPFQIQLSRHLAHRGHTVTHVYYTGQPGPKAELTLRPDDAATLDIIGITLDRVVDQKALVTRFFSEAAYGRKVAQLIRQVRPDTVLAANAPPGALRHIIKACKAVDARFVYWLQDVWSVAISTFLSKQLGPPGAAIGRYYRWLDRQQLRQSDAIIAITDDFVDLASDWGGDRAKVTVIENWGAINDIPVRSKDNAWSRAHELHNSFVYLYAGTLGRKHNPELLAMLASNSQGMVVVAAQGVAVPDLAKMTLSHGQSSLKLLPLQPAAEFADMLGAADVLVAMIEAEAGSFAVPSKVLSYMCAGRPILLAAPKENLAAKTVWRADCGIVVDPFDVMGFTAAATQLFGDADLRERLGRNGRAYAEQTFDIETIAVCFEAVLSDARAPHTLPQRLAAPL